ncbi:hypothetical protein [Paenibacillus sp. y28]
MTRSLNSSTVRADSLLERSLNDKPSPGKLGALSKTYASIGRM